MFTYCIELKTVKYIHLFSKFYSCLKISMIILDINEFIDIKLMYNIV